MAIESTTEDYQYESADVSHLISRHQLEEVNSYVSERVNPSSDIDQTTFNRCLLAAQVLDGMGISSNVGYFASINGIPQQYGLFADSKKAVILFDGSHKVVKPIEADIPIEINLGTRTTEFIEKNSAAVESARNFGSQLRSLVEA
ncbi:hypothetical protein KC678_02390 [Candidatus Dojkabacteria bacterium]|uniref:Uncharacterized protein n=1 Tax=Candidatus Dojkabacteria bacterium TaxID=2099670 RepID=A0A955IF91_9BACT|nr:hypothetical protein [Candidatus Dojkabacteria bacterium]